LPQRWQVARTYQPSAIICERGARHYSAGVGIIRSMLKLGSATVPLIDAELAGVEYVIYEPNGLLVARLLRAESETQAEIDRLQVKAKAAEALERKATTQKEKDAAAKEVRAVTLAVQEQMESVWRKQVALIWQPQDHESVLARLYDAGDPLGSQLPGIVRGIIEYQAENPTTAQPA